MEEDWDSLVGALPPAQGGAVSQAAGAKDKHSVAEDDERSVCPIAAVIESVPIPPVPAAGSDAVVTSPEFAAGAGVSSAPILEDDVITPEHIHRVGSFSALRILTDGPKLEMNTAADAPARSDSAVGVDDICLDSSIAGLITPGVRRPSSAGDATDSSATFVSRPSRLSAVSSTSMFSVSPESPFVKVQPGMLTPIPLSSE